MDEGKANIVIRQALDGYLRDNLPTLGLTIDDVSWYNAQFTPDATKLYLRPRFLAGESELSTYGKKGLVTMVGLYQVDALGIPNVGSKQLEEMSSAIQALLPVGSRITREGVTALITSASVGNNTVDGLRPVTPITFTWNANFTRPEIKGIVI